MLKGKIAVFILIITFAGTAVANQGYQLKRFNELMNQADQLSAELYTYFNSGTDITRQGQLDMFQQKALPQVESYNNLASQLNKLVLPAKKKKIATTRSKLIVLECRRYQLLYLQFKDQDYDKYRVGINETTSQINTLKAQLETINKK